jgi:hypothetical protein
MTDIPGSQFDGPAVGWLGDDAQTGRTWFVVEVPEVFSYRSHAIWEAEPIKQVGEQMGRSGREWGIVVGPGDQPTIDPENFVHFLPFLVKPAIAAGKGVIVWIGHHGQEVAIDAVIDASKAAREANKKSHAEHEIAEVAAFARQFVADYLQLPVDDPSLTSDRLEGYNVDDSVFLANYGTRAVIFSVRRIDGKRMGTIIKDGMLQAPPG